MFLHLKSYRFENYGSLKIVVLTRPIRIFMVARHNVFMYTQDISVCYLPDGYFGVIGIPSNDEEDVEIPKGNEGSLSDVPSPSNDTIVANPSASSSPPTNCH